MWPRGLAYVHNSRFEKTVHVKTFVFGVSQCTVVLH